MSFIKQAFETVCKDAKPAVGAYVSLMENVRVYLGPEEGGSYGDDTYVVAYQWYETEEAAEAAREAVQKLANGLSQQARTEHGRHCLRQMEWLDARGLDADFLPEDDGPSEYFVQVTAELPEGRTACRQYS